MRRKIPNYVLCACTLLAAALLFSGGCKKTKDRIILIRTGTPEQATNPTPADGATDILLTQTLAWDDAEGATVYSVYFGTSSPGTFQGNQAIATFDPGGLTASTDYFWRVDTHNDDGTTFGVLWTFSTGALPAQAANPTPADGAIQVPLDQQLSWDNAADATEYVVYFGTTSPGTLQGCQSSTAFDPSALTGSTMYYWRIDTVNAIGTVQGAVWSFRSLGLPGQASNPIPADNATDVSATQELSWTAAEGAEGYHVYFGTTAPGADMGCQAGVTFNPGALQGLTTYYWRIDAYNSDGTTTGDVWSFVTGPGSLWLNWAKRAGEVNDDAGRAITTLSDGTTLVVGYFYGCATFGPGEPGEVTVLTSDELDQYDIFVAKYGPDGTFQNVTTAGGTGDEDPTCIDALPDGSFFIGGNFYGNAVFGAGETNETTLLDDGGGGDIFIASYDNNGELLWAQSVYAAPGWDVAADIAALPDGSCVATGYYFGCAVFGLGQPSETTLQPLDPFGGEAVFVAKYDNSGQLVWVKQFTAPDTGVAIWCEGYSIAVNSDGLIFVTGCFMNQIIFGYGEPNEVQIDTMYPWSWPTADPFLACLNPDGTLAWATSARANAQWQWCYGFGLDTFSDGSVLWTGNFLFQATFGYGTPQETTFMDLGCGSSYDIFLARYATDGTLIWAKQAGGFGYDEGYSVAVFGDDTFYASGYFDDSFGDVVFGPGEPNEVAISFGSDGTYLAHYNADGTILDAKNIDANSNAWNWINALGISNDAVFMTGTLVGPSVFGAGEPFETPLTPAGFNDIFIARFYR